jgi:hypothetical protein
MLFESERKCRTTDAPLFRAVPGFLLFAFADRLEARYRAAAPATGRKPRRPRAPKPATPAESPSAAPADLAPDHLAERLKARGPMSPPDLLLASGLSLDAFEAQCQAEAARGLLREIQPDGADGERRLVVA